MRYLIGYQPADELDSTYELCRDFNDAVSGVYFSLPGAPSARAVLDVSLREETLEELRAIRSLGKRLVMLYNANCYGAQAMSGEFQKRILREVEFARCELDISEITTTSPFVAQTIKQVYPDLGVCASVNMRIGSVQAMQLLKDFDSFYLQREFIYNPPQIERMKSWCDEHGKTLKLIANSGCLYDCPFHTYHDNLVAHEAEIYDGASIEKEPSPCWSAMHRLSDEEAAALFLQGNWIRPEDISLWEPWFSEAKLATRMHSCPRRVVSAYAHEHFCGNLTDLTEPAFSTRFADHILDASKLPKDFTQRKRSCNRRCETCGACRAAAREALYCKAELERMFLRNS